MWALPYVCMSAQSLAMTLEQYVCRYGFMGGCLGCPVLSSAVHGTLASLQLRSGMPCLVPESWPGRADDIVSDKVRQQLEQRERALQQSEEAPAMTGHQAAEYKRQLLALMQPGESVTEALRRASAAPCQGRQSRSRFCSASVPCIPV